MTWLANSAGGDAKLFRASAYGVRWMPSHDLTCADAAVVSDTYAKQAIQIEMTAFFFIRNEIKVNDEVE
jgi:hypothetical protein